ncbi:MAG: ricin-type beta-trefoil lectin domain protein [Desulfopila sp.]|jgi:hypothetical protein|nr:ricin-type beta-trefoil lectin domain protein [Desulfopila sp.]
MCSNKGGVHCKKDPQTASHSAKVAELLGKVVFLLVIIPFTVPLSANALMGGNGLMWTVWQSEPVKLVVCWEDPGAASSERREWVRLALKNSWERETRIIFTGWEQCQNEASPATPPHTLGPRRPGIADENIKIEILTSGGGQNPAHGSWGDYQQHGVRLNLQGDRANTEFLAIHEFGHALGLYHGEERGDWDISGCPQQTYAPSWPWWPVPTEMRWGAPDPDSIMAYCSNRPTSLSPGDVAGIQRAYGRHIPGSLLSLPGSLCLSAHAGAGNGSDAFGWACDEALDDQEWRWDITKKALYVQAPDDPTENRRCLDVDTNSYSDVQTWDCHYGSNQQWQFQKTMVRGYGGLCLTRPADGQGAVTIEECTGADEQLWRIEKSDIAAGRVARLRAESKNLCLTQEGPSGSNAVVKPCSPSNLYAPVKTKPTGKNQNTITLVHFPGKPVTGIRDFLLGDGGQIGIINFLSGTLCLDVRDVWDSQYLAGNGGPRPGQVVQFFQCYDNQLNQRWNFSGQLVSGGKCLALDGDAVDNGAGAIVTDCTNADQQKWDYYW